MEPWFLGMKSSAPVFCVADAGVLSRVTFGCERRHCPLLCSCRSQTWQMLAVGVIQVGGFIVSHLGLRQKQTYTDTPNHHPQIFKL